MRSKHAEAAALKSSQPSLVLLVTLTSLLHSGGAYMHCSCRPGNALHRNIAVSCNDVNTNGSETVVCDTGPPVSTVSRWTQYVPPGYFYIPDRSVAKWYKVQKTWFEARDICRREGGQLFVPRDKATIAAIRKAGVDYSVFTGINDLQSEGVYRDTDGKLVEFFNWVDGEPNNLVDNEDCVELRWNDRMNDLPCDTLFMFMCEWPLTAPLPAAYSYLPDGGFFHRLSEGPATHAEAAAACARDGGRLFAPDSWPRLETLLRAVPVDTGDLWVDLTDTETEGDFVTSTGRRVPDLSSWGWLPGEPDNGGHAGTDEDCVALHSHGFFSDLDCGQRRRYVCQRLP